MVYDIFKEKEHTRHRKLKRAPSSNEIKDKCVDWFLYAFFCSLNARLSLTQVVCLITNGLNIHWQSDLCKITKPNIG